MNDSPLDPCGCCESELPEPVISNPPGQPSLSYRAAPHGEAFRRMVARLPRWRLPDGEREGERPLGSLTTRASDDPAVAMLDAWAVVTDVLTFYQERIANEGYLRTATERRSVLELARAIGYELNPGVSASTYLSFVVDESPGAPREASIPAGTQVQSLPAGAGELPQTFETSEVLAAFAEWNSLRPRMNEPQLVDLDSLTTLYLAGTALNLKAGAVLLLVEPDAQGNATAFGIYTVRSALADSENDRTILTLDTKAISAGTTNSGKALALAAPAGPVVTGAQLFSAGAIEGLVLSRALSEGDLQVVLKSNRWKREHLLAYTNDARTLPSASIQTYALRDRAGFFGHNAPLWESLPALQRFGGTVDGTSVAAVYPSPGWDDPGNTIWTNSGGDDYELDDDADVYLERAVSELLADSWTVFAGRTSDGQMRWEPFQLSEVSEASLADYAISGKVTGLRLRGADGSDVVAPDRERSGFFRRRAAKTKEPPDSRVQFLLRKSTAHVRSERLALATMPMTEPLVLGSTALTLDRMVVGLREGQPLALTGEQADAPGTFRSEILFLRESRHEDGLTTLEFTSGLSYSYTRSTVTLNANVVLATHGETIPAEVLGSGNGAVSNQQFALKKPPLTHTSAATASGVDSALTVRVNGVEWRQVASLYGLEPTSQGYIVRLEDDASATVIFGDGKQGARLPTGRENVVASYRSGTGSAGEVAAGSLTLMKTRPFGARGVSNPLDAMGAADPETLDDARSSAPLTVMTLGRIVSLRDFEDFARSFAGIGKARAVSLWSGERQRVHLTIADANGDEIATTSELYRNFASAVQNARDPLREVEIESFDPVFFNVQARIWKDPSFLWEEVKVQIMGALVEKFSFDERSFGQPVTSAELMSVIHSVPGVVAMDLDALFLVDEAGAQVGDVLSAILPSRLARHDAATGAVLPAQLLLVNEAGITLTEMK